LNQRSKDHETVLQAMRAGFITNALNTHRMPLARVPEDFAGLLDPAAGVIKAIVEC
jgi:threonine dehydrogenase-like Zn-dependent dehydrogenase